MKTHQTTIGKSDEWITPTCILDNLGSFDLDPCSPVIKPWETAFRYYTEVDDGLSKEWSGRVGCNPPFHRYIRPLWMKKMSEHNNGILLIPAAMETKAFSNYVFGKCSGMLFLDSRPHFCYVDGTAARANCGCTIVLVAYGSNNLDVLKNSGLGHVVTEV